MEVKVCVGSACYVKGSHQVIEGLEKCIKKYDVEASVVLKAAFCLGHCTQAVSVSVDGIIYSVQPGGVDTFFKTVILKKG